jgi:hypothetical protein
MHSRMHATARTIFNVGTKRIAATAHPVLPDDSDYTRLWRGRQREQLKPLRGLPAAHRTTHPRGAADAGLGESPRDGQLVNTVDRTVLPEAKFIHPDVQTQPG